MASLLLEIWAGNVAAKNAPLVFILLHSAWQEKKIPDKKEKHGSYMRVLHSLWCPK